MYYRCDRSIAQTAPNLAAAHDNKMHLSWPGRAHSLSPWESCSVIDRALGPASSLRIVFRVRLGGAGTVVSVVSRQPPCCNLKEEVLCMHRRSNQLFYLFFGLAQPEKAVREQRFLGPMFAVPQSHMGNSI